MTAVKTARQVVDDAYAALFERGSVDEFLTDFDENSVMLEADSLPYGGRFQGPANIKAAMENVFGIWKDFSYDIEGTAYDEEYVIAYGKFSATSVKTGTKFSTPLAEVWHIRNGKVVLLHPVYSDTKAAVDALGG